MISSYKPTSKTSLKQFCLVVAKGDVEDASKLYDFMIKDMEELPVFDPVAPTFMDNAKNAVTGVLDFVRDNKDGIAQVSDVVRSIIGKRGAAVNVPTEALPPIN